MRVSGLLWRTFYSSDTQCCACACLYEMVSTSWMSVFRGLVSAKSMQYQHNNAPGSGWGGGFGVSGADFLLSVLRSLAVKLM